MRILLLLLALIAVRFAIGAPLEALGVPMLITGIVTAAALLAVFWKVDREPLRGGYRQLGQGAAIGAGLFTGTLLLIGMFGLLHFDGVNGLGAIWPVLGISILAGVFEELVLRGVVFRWLEQKLGMWWALAISALVFGGLHFFNPGATIFSALAIALEAGVLLGLAYVATRRLWLPIGLHIAWNFTESGLFGVRPPASPWTACSAPTSVDRPSSPAAPSGWKAR